MSPRDISTVIRVAEKEGKVKTEIFRVLLFSDIDTP
jgi:hypothetical protein